MFKYIKSKNSLTLNKFLKKKLKKNESVFRYNFHKNNDDTNQLMMIWQRKGYFFPPKKFLDSHKLYILMKGRLNVFIFDSKGNIKKIHKLNKNDQICRIRKNVYHADVSVSNTAIHCEVTNHSFNHRKIKFIRNKFMTKAKNQILKKTK